MSGKSMDIFSLRDSVVNEYRKFATSFTTIYADDIRRQVDAIYAEGRFWPDPLIQINPKYKEGAKLEKLIEAGALEPRTADIFRVGGSPISLYKHQERAVALAAGRESYVVTTGTGSGKSLCFFIPIVSAIIAEKRRDPARRTRAIIIYPMNALANSQLEELQKFVGNIAGEPPVTFERYTGQEDAEERERISKNPPDILLTNFMMLELLMTRQDEVDRRVIGNCTGLRFLVLDELHTYRGRQGADVALLVRRVRERLSPERLLCIGTSATMTSEGTTSNKQDVVARVASKLFATKIEPSNVIIEELDRVTDSSKRAESVRASLGPAIDATLPDDISDAALRVHPLAIWIETRLGITTTDANPAWHRAQPRTLDVAAAELSAESGRDANTCGAALRRLLLLSSRSERDRTGKDTASDRSFFAFKLHQFISGAGHAFATLEPAGQRTVTVDGQQYLPAAPAKRLYPVHFCRDCGQEYHPVRYKRDTGERVFLPRDIDDAPPAREDDQPEDADDESAGGEVFGFLTLQPPDADFTFKNENDDYPETWLELDAKGNVRMKAHYRRVRVQEVTAAPDGTSSAGAKAWFIPGRFRFCLRCGAARSAGARDRTRLASLSSEGRSSATTVIVGSALRWMHGSESTMKAETRKLLGFTDNRQDAALQAGHFNDFLFVSLIRAGFLGALDAAGEKGLRSDELGAAQQRALGFDRPSPELRAEWLLDPALTKGIHLMEAEEALRQVLSYRVWFDQRRGWRYTNPNLEQLGLVDVEYRALDDLVKDETAFAAAPDVLKMASPAVRAAVYAELFDHLRKWMAVRSQVLEPTAIEQMLQRSHSRLRAPWGFGSEEKPRKARWLLISPPSRKETSLRDEDLIVRGGSRSSLGRILRSSQGLRSAQFREGRKLWDNPTVVRALHAPEMDALIQALLKAAVGYGLVSEEVTPFGDLIGYRLSDTAVLFKRGRPQADSFRSNENAFFRDFYANLDVCIDLFRGGYVSVDRGTGHLTVAQAVLECMGSPDNPPKDWQHDLTSAAPPEPREYRLMQDLVSGSLFPAVGPPPKGRRFPVAPISLDLARIEEIPKADLMLAVALAVRSRQESSQSEAGGGEIERTHYVRKHRVIDVTIPRRGGPTADPNGEVNSVRAQMIVAARPRMMDGDEAPSPTFRIVGPTNLPAQIRQRIALGLSELWESGVAREPDQFFAKLRYDEDDATNVEEEANVAVTGPAARLRQLEEVISAVGDQTNRHEEIAEVERLADGEIAAVNGFGSRVEVVVGAAAHHELALNALQTAQEQVVLACPWVGQIATNQPLRAALAMAVERGVRIHLLWGVTKDERREDTFKGDSWDFLSKLAPGKAAGCIYVADRPSGCHAKLITCDLDWAVVTSCNFLNSARDRQTQEVGVRVFTRVETGLREAGQSSWTVADRRPVVARAVMEVAEWARLVTPDYRLRRSISSDPVLFGRREDITGVQLGGGVLAPDPKNPLSVSLWKEAWTRRLREHRNRLSATGVAALPVRDAEHRHLLLHALASASQRVVVASPELGVGALGSHMVAALTSARARGVAVTLVFAEERIREAIRFSDRKRELEAAGVFLTKLDSHAKLLVCDDWAIVTSFNFLSFEGYYDNDRRARHEFGIRVLDRGVADRLVQLLGLPETVTP